MGRSTPTPGSSSRARFAVMATGGLSAPNRPSWPGIDTFAGTIVQTSLWPEEGVELEGKRIGIVGTGSSGVQAIPELAKIAEHLTVFQRTAAFTWPSRNQPLSADEQAAIKARYRQLREEQYASFSGTAGTTGAVIFAVPERRAAHPREHAGGARGRAGGARVQRVPHLDRHRDRPRRQRDGGRALPRDGAAHGRRSRRRRVVVAPRLPARMQTSGARLELLRDVQPRQRHPRRPAQGPDPGGHADGRPHRAAVRGARRARARHRLRRHDRRAHAHRRARAGRSPAARRLGRRTPDLSRRRHRGLPEPLHLRRTRQPRGARHLPAADRAAGRVDRRLHRPSGRTRVHTCRGGTRRAGRVVRRT